MAVSLTGTLPEHWKYISEGGATIVFDYIGPSDPLLDGTALRLRKRLIRTTSPPSPVFEELQEEREDPMIKFQQKCMQRLIPVEHLPRLASVRVDRPWLERLAFAHDAVRPLDRRIHDEIDLSHNKGVLATDLVGGDWLAVEIKPKWGFLPSPTHLSDATRAIKTQTCRFCMHSRVKTATGEKAAAVGYCPLDLFSGQEHRVKTAIYSLWDAWVESNGTINNLKIFSRGKHVLPPNMQMIVSDDASASDHAKDLREAFTTALLPILMETSILRTVSNLQRMLDVLDIEGLSKLWRVVEVSEPLFSSFPSSLSSGAPSANNSSPQSSSEPTISEWTEFLDRYLSPASSKLDHANPRPENLRYYLLAYLLSATFKDCSMIVRMNLLGAGHPFPVKPVPEQVVVIDLDPKGLDRLRKWERLDRDIVEANISADNRKICIDRY